jgi:hypothetical protein
MTIFFDGPRPSAGRRPGAVPVSSAAMDKPCLADLRGTAGPGPADGRPEAAGGRGPDAGAPGPGREGPWRPGQDKSTSLGTRTAPGDGGPGKN